LSGGRAEVGASLGKGEGQRLEHIVRREWQSAIGESYQQKWKDYNRLADVSLGDDEKKNGVHQLKWRLPVD
jgi:hypothetical protein